MKAFAGEISRPRRAAGFEQMKRADDVRVDEIARPGDGTVHMRFGGEMQDVGDGVLFDDAPHGGLVAQINALENIFGMTRDRFDVGGVASVSEAVQVDQARDLRALDDLMDDVRADEAGAAGEQEVHAKQWGWKR